MRLNVRVTLHQDFDHIHVTVYHSSLTIDLIHALLCGDHAELGDFGCGMQLLGTTSYFDHALQFPLKLLMQSPALCIPTWLPLPLHFAVSCDCRL